MSNRRILSSSVLITSGIITQQDTQSVKQLIAQAELHTEVIFEQQTQWLCKQLEQLIEKQTNIKTKE